MCSAKVERNKVEFVRTGHSSSMQSSELFGISCAWLPDDVFLVWQVGKDGPPAKILGSAVPAATPLPEDFLLGQALLMSLEGPHRHRPARRTSRPRATELYEAQGKFIGKACSANPWMDKVHELHPRV